MSFTTTGNNEPGSAYDVEGKTSFSSLPRAIFRAETHAIFFPTPKLTRIMSDDDDPKHKVDSLCVVIETKVVDVEIYDFASPNE